LLKLRHLYFLKQLEAKPSFPLPAPERKETTKKKIKFSPLCPLFKRKISKDERKFNLV
jgi:hypothetical protein